MKFEIQFVSYSEHQLDLIKLYVLEEDYQALKRFITADYQVYLKDSIVLSGTDSLLLMMSSLLYCIVRIHKNEKCALYLSDSPPTLVLEPISYRKINIFLDSYGTPIVEELSDTAQLIKLFIELVDKCYEFMQKSTMLSKDQLVSILKEINSDISDIYLNI